jgi:cation diffusion facilitator family transporter
VVEIVGGHLFGSMALVADGWHMSTHAGALAIAACAYRLASRHADDPRFSFGTGKFGELAGFASAVILAIVALLIAYESAIRLVSPVTIRFDEAIPIAVVGLMVNLATAWLLYDEDHHDHGHRHDRDHDVGDADHHGDDAAGHMDHHHGGRDHNLRSAYFHVLADALTSVLAIAALLAGRLFGWAFLDPAMGIVGAVVITIWSVGLMRSAAAVLVDVVPDDRLAALVRSRLEIGTDRVADLHLWRLGPGHMGLVTVLVSDRPQPPSVYKARLHDIAGLSHVTVEVQQCPDLAACAA